MDARISNAEPRRVSMAPSGVLERVKSSRIAPIRGFEARLDAKKLGSGLVAFAFVKSDDLRAVSSRAQALAAILEVQEVHHIAGEDCYLIKIRVADGRGVGTPAPEKVGVIPSIRSTRTTIVMETLEETATVLIPGPSEGIAMQSERQKWLTIVAFAVVYLVWAPTYLGIRIGLETMPPCSWRGRGSWSPAPFSAVGPWLGGKTSHAWAVAASDGGGRAAAGTREWRRDLGGAIRSLGDRRAAGRFRTLLAGSAGLGLFRRPAPGARTTAGLVISSGGRHLGPAPRQ